MARHHPARRSRLPSILAAAIEPLEQRRLLTRILGGQTFIFADDEGNSTIVRATGDIVVDLVGAVFDSERDVDEGEDPADFARLGDIPGVILGDDGSQTEIRGGYGGPPPDDPDAEDTNPIWSGLWGIFATSNDPEATLTITRGEAFYDPLAEQVRFSNVVPFESPDDIELSSGQSLGLGASSGTSFLGLRRDDDSVIRTRNANIYDGDRPPDFTLSGFIQPIIRLVGPLQRFYFAGTLTGSALFNGNVQNLYAGNILTGVINGESRRNPAPNDNFTIIGEVGQFTVNGYVGTGDYAPELPGDVFKTGTEIVVTGRVGSLYVAEDMRAKLDIVGTAPTSFMNAAQIEYEATILQSPQTGSDGGLGAAFMDGSLGADNLQNDSVATAQPIFTGFLPDTGRGNSAMVSGSLFPGPDFDDPIDHYALPLLGGQSATIRVIPRNNLPVNVAVRDPDGRIIASDRSNRPTEGANVGADNTNRDLRFVASTPGIYTIVVTTGSDLNFNGVEDDPVLHLQRQHIYDLVASRTSDASIGIIRVVGDLYADREIPEDPDTQKEQPPIRLRNGDLGGIWVGGDFRARRSGAVAVLTGGIRVIDAGNIGLIDINEGFESLNLQVPLGNVGQVRSRGSLLWLNDRALRDNGTPEPTAAIGGTYQLIDVAGGRFVGHLTANKGLGTLRAQRIGDDLVLAPSFFAFNVDRSGDDGFVDLIDVSGDMGTLAAGGPALDVGPGGNIRYIRVGGTAYRDRLFGSGVPEPTVYEPRRTVSFTDDSGTRLLITPIRFIDRTSNPLVETPIVDGQITLTTLPVRSGGSVILRLQTTQSVQLVSNRVGAGAEIGQLVIGGNAAPLVDDPTNGLTFPATGALLDLETSGSTPIGIFQLQGGRNFRNLRIPNGEIVIADLGDVDTLALQSIGVPRSSSGATIKPLGVIPNGNTYPFRGQSFGINVGDVRSLSANDGVGNVIASGTIQSLVANADGRFTKGLDEGIVAPVRAGGELRDVNIGEALYPSGTGEFAWSGLFAGGRIIRVTNPVPGSDVRGDIVSLQGIDLIELNGGSIIDADIFVGLDFNFASELEVVPLLPGGTDVLNRPRFTLKTISVSGGGGILGSFFAASNIDTLNVDGFGMGNSRVLTAGDGTLRDVVTTGLGLRAMDLRGGAAVYNIEAKGTTGQTLDLRNYPSTVRFSNVSTYDPFSGIAVNPANDLNALLGTGKRSPSVPGITTEGVIRDSLLAGSRSLNTLTAYRIDVTADHDLPPTDPAFWSRISFGNRIGRITAHGPVAGVQLTAGGIEAVSIGGELRNSSFTVSGRVSSFSVRGSVRGNTIISARGSQGIIDQFVVRGSLFGDIAATRFGDIYVGRDLGTGRLRSFGNVNSLRVVGNVLLGSYTRATGAMASLWVEGDLQIGSTIRAAAFGSVRIDGIQAGDIVVG